jgi:hypothetical protein
VAALTHLQSTMLMPCRLCQTTIHHQPVDDMSGHDSDLRLCTVRGTEGHKNLLSQPCVSAFSRVLTSATNLDQKHIQQPEVGDHASHSRFVISASTQVCCSQC